MSTKKALITGISGQDGSYLAEFLLDKGYEVIGLDRPRAVRDAPNLRRIIGHPRLMMVPGDLLEQERLQRIILQHEPDEIYNLGAQSFVPVSWDLPVYTVEVDAVGPLRILEILRHHLPDTRFYQASSSEIFGKVQETPQRETTYHYPRSPYACAKSFAMNLVRNYRESFDLFACNGICFNHESERRGEDFVTRKVTKAVAAIHAGHLETMRIGNLDARRDWGYAPDYVRAMWMIMNAPQADDWVVATGKAHSIRDFVTAAFAEISIEIEWNGSGLDEVGTDPATGRTIVQVDERFFRPAEVELLQGDPSRIASELGWVPETSFEQMIQRMVRSDIAALSAAPLEVVA